MDSKDSVNAFTREGAVPLPAAASTDDDGVLSVASSLGKEATGLFQCRKYAECVDVLRQLLEKNPDDVKVLHNIAIAVFFKEGCTNPKNLLESLTNAKKRCEDLALESGEQGDATSHTGNKAISVPKGNNQMSTLGGESMVYTDESDASLAILNMGIIYFILHRYSRAQSILGPLFQNIESLDEITALRVCILLLDVATATPDVSIFADVVKYLERTFDVGYIFNYPDTRNTGQQQPSDLVWKYYSVTENASNSNYLNSEVPGTRNTSEDSLFRTLSEETLEYETLLSSLDYGGKNVSRSSKFQSSYALSERPDEHTFSPVLKLMLPLYRVRLSLLTRSLKEAKREVKLAMNDVWMGDSFRVLILKSQLEYVRGNYTEAMELLEASKNQTEVESSVISNNYGCIFYQQGNHHTSGIFFQKALTSCSSLQKENPKSITSFSQDKRSLIVYNCGVQHLACGKPMLAASCFQAANPVLHNRPLLWLRLAECCLMALRKRASKSSAHAPRVSGVKLHVVGQGKWRYLAINKGFSRNDQMKLREGDSEMHPSDEKPKLSLSYSWLCLKNAHHLLSFPQSKNVKSGFTPKPNQEKSEQSDGTSLRYSIHGSTGGSSLKAASKEMMSSGLVNSSRDVKDQRDGSTVSPGTMLSISDYEELLKRESQMIMQAVLVDLAFVELELGNPLRALSTARSLLDLPECSKMHAFLGHIYAAEALCYLNRTNEAAEHLSVYVGDGQKVELPYTTEDFEQWQVKRSVDNEDVNMASKTAPIEADIFLKPEEAKGALYTNLAAMFSMQGDLEKASRFAYQALAIIPDSIEAALMVVYLDLKRGNTEAAVAKLKLCKCVRFWRSDLKS